MQQWLQSQRDLTGAVLYGGFEAEVVRCAALDLKLEAPLTLTTFRTPDGSAPSAGPIRLGGDVTLTSHAIPDREVGRAAVEMLLRKLENPARALKPRAVPFEFDAGARRPSFTF